MVRHADAITGRCAHLIQWRGIGRLATKGTVTTKAQLQYILGEGYHRALLALLLNIRRTDRCVVVGEQLCKARGLSYLFYSREWAGIRSNCTLLTSKQDGSI